jgi:dethiobiotin synthetase
VPTVFVTGTGTDVGKTFVTAALIRHFRGSGRPVDALKPVLSGFDQARIAESEAGALLAALGCSMTADDLDRISPWRFAAPMSPHLAAKAEGRVLDFRAVVDHCRAAEAHARGMLLIEGVGGVMVPLDDRHTVLDWISALRAPVLLVAGSYLGTISHTLTALHVLAQRNLDIAAVVVNESKAPGASLDDTVATVARFAAPIEVFGLPRLSPGASPPPAILEHLRRVL